jgi:apolipoprotein N-acyltransferase
MASFNAGSRSLPWSGIPPEGHSSTPSRVWPSGCGVNQNSQIKILIIPAIWVAIEWIRAHFLTGFGWVLLGYSQTDNPAIIQIADITGAYGVSFLIAIVNASIFFTIRGLRKKEYRAGYLVMALTLVFITEAYGIIKLKSVFAGERIKVAVVQGNIPQSEKWDDRFRKGILQKYEKLTMASAKNKPDLVIWPETSVPDFIELNKNLSAWAGDLSVSIAAPILLGAPGEDVKTGALRNSAVMFGKDGKITGRYDKLHLVPFGEYVPFKKFLSFVERFAPSPIGDFSPGADFSIFSFFIERRSAENGTNFKLVRKVKFACLICFEDIFPELSRESVKRGANFLVNITNDAWFKYSSAPYQHVQSSIFRAVENRVNVARAANTGVSCIISPKGEIIAAVGSGHGEIFVDGFAIGDIALTRIKTFYTAYGDLFAFACMLLTALCVSFKRNSPS